MRPVWFVIAVSLLLTAACGGGQSTAVAENGVPQTLRVGLVPNISPDEQKAKYEPFAEYMEKKLGVDVELFVAADYAGVVAALAGKRIDMAYLGGLTYVQADEQVDLTPVVTEIDRDTGTTEYVSAIVVKKDSPYRVLRKDIVESSSEPRVFAFGDVSSTSGSLYPRIMLSEAGARCSPERVDECPPLKRVSFTGGHDAAAQAVLSGQADAAGLELRILRRLEKEGAVGEGDLRVIAEHRVPGYPWVVRTELGERARNAIAVAFTAISDPGLLDLMRAERYERVTPGDYQDLRVKAKELGLLEVAS